MSFIDTLNFKLSSKRPSSPLKILDVGTGSGCIAISLLHHLAPWVEVEAIDINLNAIKLARLNAQRLLPSNAQPNLHQCDLFQIHPSSNYDIILSNPPYITTDEYEHLEDSVRQWEDVGALVGVNGNGWMEYFRHLISIVPRVCPFDPSIPRMIVEIGGTHQISFIEQENASKYRLEFHKDFSGRIRHVSFF